MKQFSLLFGLAACGHQKMALVHWFYWCLILRLVQKRRYFTLYDNIILLTIDLKHWSGKSVEKQQKCDDRVRNTYKMATCISTALKALSLTWKTLDQHLHNVHVPSNRGRVEFRVFLPGWCPQVQFYVPREKQLHNLRVSSQACPL